MFVPGKPARRPGGASPPPRRPLAVERRRAGRAQLRTLGQRQAGAIQARQRPGRQRGAPSTCPGACLLSLEGEVRGASYQKESGINSTDVIWCPALRGYPFLKKAIRRHGVPEKITIDGSAANAAAIRSYNREHGTAIIIRQVKYLNNIVEQDHRGVKRVTRTMMGFKSFEA